MYAAICWLLLALANCPAVQPSVTHRFTIGAVLSSKQSREYFLQEIDNIQKDLGPNVNLRARTVPMHPNPIQTANEVCTKLIPHQVHTVVVSHLPDLLTNQTAILTDHNSASSVSFTCGFLGVPVISISNRNSALSDKQLHRTFLRTVPAFTSQAKIWLLLLRRLRYNNFILIHRADQEGLSALSKVNEWAHRLKMQMETVIAFEEIFSNVRTTSRSHAEEDAMFESIFSKGGGAPAGGAGAEQAGADSGYIPPPSIASHDNQFSYNASQLRGKFENVLRSTNCRVFLLYANTAEEAMYVIRVAKGLNMFSPGFVWILSEQSLTAPSLMGAQLSDLPEGALAVRLSTKASDERRHIRDAVTLITKAIKKLTKNMSGIPSTAPPSNCNTTSYQNWTLGAQMLQLLRNEKLENGTTGRLAFDYKGDRLETDYDIVNIQHSVVNNTIVRVKKIVGQHFYSVLANGSSLAVNISDIIWPGGVKEQPLGYFVPTHLNIVTLPEQPFVETRRVYPKDDVEGGEKNKQKGMDPLNPLFASGINQVKMSSVINDSLHFSTPEYFPESDLNKNFSQHPNWTPDALLIKRSTSKLQYLCKVNEVHCPHYNESTGHTKHYCCSGYCIDLLLRVADALNFTFNLYQVNDLSYGSKRYLENRVEWNGLIGELLSKRADMAIATLTINPERAKVIDFSKPYKYEGIAMLQLRVSKGARLASFLQPFHGTLWCLVLFSVYVVALVLYLLDRFSPFGQFVIKYTNETDTCALDNQTRVAADAIQHTGQNGELKRKASALSGQAALQHTEEKEFSPGEKPLTLSGAIWFSWGVLLNSGIGEKTPRSFSARVLGMIWAGFAMIVVASYTANLAAFLVLDSTETQIQGLEDARLRNPAEGFTYGTVQNSAVDLYFRGQVVLSNMYRLMEENNRPTAQEAIDAVKNGDMNVFFWDSPRLEYEASRDCDLVISGETFGRSGYGIALQKNSFWTERVTLQLLRLIESGFMETLDNKWILRTDKRCDKYLESSFPTTLGLENMAGVFILVGAGILASCGCIFIEIAYKRRRLNRLRALTSAKRCALKWRMKVKQRRLEKEFGEPVEKTIDKDAKLEAHLKQYQSESRPTTVTPTSAATKHHAPSRPTGFSNQIYPTSQYPMAYLPSQSPVYPYTIESGVQEMRMASKMSGQMRAHPISSTGGMTSPNSGNTMGGKVKGAQGFGINQPPVAAAYVRSAPSAQQVPAKPRPGPPVKLKRADMYIATRHKEDLNYFELPPCPPPPSQKLSQRAFRQ